MENHQACGASQENETFYIFTDHIYYKQGSTVRVRHSASVRYIGLLLGISHLQNNYSLKKDLKSIPFTYNNLKIICQKY